MSGVWSVVIVRSLSSCPLPRSPIEADEKEVIKLAKKLKKEKVSAVVVLG